ncbi:MAG: hypothetical protein EOO38_01575, partial [Cytophagaceae bacterium]
MRTSDTTFALLLHMWNPRGMRLDQPPVTAVTASWRHLLRRIITTLAAISLMASTVAGVAQDKPSLADRRAI